MTDRGEQVATHLGEVGKLPVAVWQGVPPRTADVSGAELAAAWRAAFEANGFPDVSGASVLLVIDTSGTTWEPTIATAALRAAGADVVLPLLVHRQVG